MGKTCNARIKVQKTTELNNIWLYNTRVGTVYKFYLLPNFEFPLVFSMGGRSVYYHIKEMDVRSNCGVVFQITNSHITHLKSPTRSKPIFSTEVWVFYCRRANVLPMLETAHPNSEIRLHTTSIEMDTSGKYCSSRYSGSIGRMTNLVCLSKVLDVGNRCLGPIRPMDLL